MATLHVRNFPDGLYDALRARATENGRSIGAETIQLLARELSTAAGWGPRRRPARGAGGLRRFTPLGRDAVAAAREAARALGHGHVGTEHVLLGLLRTDGVGGRTLASLGLTEERVRQQLEAGPGAAEEPPAGELPFGPETKKALELALRESLAMRQTLIGTEHLVVGIASEGESLGARMVQAVEPSLDRLRTCLLNETGVQQAWAFPPQPEFRVVELTGDSAAWAATLNAAVEDGYDLVDVVGDRAVFRRP